MYIENKINDKLKNIVFLELKKDTDVNGFLVKKDTPLPINLDELFEGIKAKDYEETINLAEIDKAIVYLIGIDSEFKYKDLYLNILNYTVNDLYKYIYSLSIKAKQKGSNLNSYIYLHALNSLCPKTLESRFAETNVLETLYDEYFKKLSDDEKAQIIERIVKEYESIIAEDREYAPAYYRLGYVNRALSFILRSF